MRKVSHLRSVDAAPSEPSTPARLVSLDAFRGFTIAGMLLVNNPGDWGNLYPQLAHAAWNGWTFTDWIFPFFLFISGISMVLSLQSRQGVVRSAAQNTALVGKLAKRAVIIFCIGLFLNFVPNFDVGTLRIPGVLQRIALCTLIAAPIVVFLEWRAQALCLIAILVAYSVAMLAIPVPDVQGVVAAGALEPGRDFGAYVDRMVLTGHMWAKSKTWDPEGLFTTLPAVCTLLFGVLSGHWLFGSANPLPRAEKLIWLLLAGLALLWLGAMLDGALMPINKSLWSTSYCVFMTGWALLVFAPFYWLMDTVPNDAIRRRSQALLLPLTMYGMNALFIFAFSGLVAKMLGFIKVAGPTGAPTSIKSVLVGSLEVLPLSPVNRSLLFAVLFNLAFVLIAWFMWKKRWFVKV